MYPVSIREPEQSWRTDLQALEGQQRLAPKGHVIVGVFKRPPYFRCQTCGTKFSNLHPKQTDEDRKLDWWSKV